MSVAPVIDQLRAALTERTRLENNFKTKILNRINAILAGLNNCDRESLPPAAAGALNIAIGDLNEIVRQIRNPDNMTDAHVAEIVEPLERRRRNNTLRLLPGTTIDGIRPLSEPAPASSLTGSRSFGSWFSRTPDEPTAVELGRLRTPDRPDVPYISRQFSDELDDDDLPGGPLGQGLPRRGGKRTRRKYHRKA